MTSYLYTSQSHDTLSKSSQCSGYLQGKGLRPATNHSGDSGVIKMLRDQVAPLHQWVTGEV